MLAQSLCVDVLFICVRVGGWTETDNPGCLFVLFQARVLSKCGPRESRFATLQKPTISILRKEKNHDQVEHGESSRLPAEDGRILEYSSQNGLQA